LLLALAIGTPAPARAAVLTFPPDADVYVSAKEPTTNFISDPELRIDVDSERITYLRFVVTGVGARPVEQARLRLEVTNGGNVGGTVYRISNTTWQKQTVTYTTRPAVDGPALHTLGAVSPGTIAEFILDGAIPGDGTYDFAIKTTVTDGVHFRSSRATSGAIPALVLIVADGTPPPPPPAPAPTEILAFEPAADTYVYAAEPNANLSSETVLHTDADSERIIYLRFAVSGLNGRPVLAARLRLEVVNASDNGGTIHSISNTTWQEQTVTFATRPAVNGPALDALGPVAFGEIVELALDGAIPGDGVYNFAIVSTSTDGAQYRSSRATSGHIPRLELTIPVGPEPTVQIAQPAVGSIFFDGDLITFQAQASDTADGNLGAAVQWASNLDGPLGIGSTVVHMLTLGTHTITATVTDSDTFMATDQITVTVTPPPPPNTAPLVAITAPANGQTFAARRAITLSAIATDLEEGVISARLVWRSSRDGALGTGASITTAGLSVGTHTVTASATDSGGLAGTATRTIVVEAAAGAGFQDFSFGSGVDSTANRATGSKPESKLWYNDHIWWATLYNPAGGGGHRIHALDPTTQTWLDTGVLVDARKTSRQDVLWTGQKLYFASRAGSGTDNRLYRFSYNPAGPTYTLDSGFPVAIPSAFTEAMTLAKDSTGKLWVAYTSGKKVFVNRTTGSDTQWGTPVQIPVTGTTVGADDIAAVQTLSGGKIGVFWSNQVTDAFYFAVHPDSAAVTSSWTLEIAASGGTVADDHLNLKRASDGRLFVAVKTGKIGSSDTLVGLLVRSASGSWSSLRQVAQVSVDPTRPSCLLDEQAGRVYVFYSPGKSAIYYKTSSMNTISFPSGKGTPFMEQAGATINNTTTTKQNVDADTGIVVVGSAPEPLAYWHNTIGLP